MSPIKKIKVNNLDISISIESNKDDYFCLTDILSSTYKCNFLGADNKQ